MTDQKPAAEQEPAMNKPATEKHAIEKPAIDKKAEYTWFDKPTNVKKIIAALCVICALLMAADLFYHKHAYFAVEKWFGFYAFYGFIMCVLLVLAAKVMRVLLMRDEDYYD